MGFPINIPQLKRVYLMISSNAIGLANQKNSFIDKTDPRKVTKGEYFKSFFPVHEVKLPIYNEVCDKALNEMRSANYHLIIPRSMQSFFNSQHNSIVEMNPEPSKITLQTSGDNKKTGTPQQDLYSLIKNDYAVYARTYPKNLNHREKSEALIKFSTAFSIDLQTNLCPTQREEAQQHIWLLGMGLRITERELVMKSETEKPTFGSELIGVLVPSLLIIVEKVAADLNVVLD